MKCIIHAGGKGERLREIWKGPKSLIPISKDNPKPLIYFHLLPFVRTGIQEYIITISKRSELPQKLGVLERELDINFEFLVEPRRIGRAGVVNYGIELGVINVNEGYIMSYPDDLVSLDMKSFLHEAKTRKDIDILLAVSRKFPSPYGIINVDGKKISFEEKPEITLQPGRYVFTGIAYYSPQAMKEFEKINWQTLEKPIHAEECIIPDLAREGKVGIFEVKGFIPINYPSDLRRVQDMKYEEIINFLFNT